jgi:hypothetical protein
MTARGTSQDKAIGQKVIGQIHTTDKARAAFVRQYLELKWPEPHLHHAMFNTRMGEACTAAILLRVSNSSSVTLSDPCFSCHPVQHGQRT